MNKTSLKNFVTWNVNNICRKDFIEMSFNKNRIEVQNCMNLNQISITYKCIYHKNRIGPIDLKVLQ